MVTDVKTIRLGPYMELSIMGGDTVAYLNGSAPHLFLRDGSDSYRLPQGQCVPLFSTSARIINPFPRHVECLIGRGLPVQFGPEAADITADQRCTVFQQAVVSRAATVNATKYGLGITLKRGRAVVWVQDRINDGESQFVIFRGTSHTMVSTRPAGFMDGAAGFFSEGGVPTADNPIVGIKGDYTDALYAQWLAESGMPAPTTQRIISGNEKSQQVLVDATTSVFVVRPVDAAHSSIVYLRHLGLDLEDFD